VLKAWRAYRNWIKAWWAEARAKGRKYVFRKALILGLVWALFSAVIINTLNYFIDIKAGWRTTFDLKLALFQYLTIAIFMVFILYKVGSKTPESR
jgi:hypothetical protein